MLYLAGICENMLICVREIGRERKGGNETGTLCKSKSKRHVEKSVRV